MSSDSKVITLEEARNVIVDVTVGRNVRWYNFVNLYGCSIGDDTRVGTFVEIQRGATVGRRCKISSHSFICEGVGIGDDLLVRNEVATVW